MTISQAVSKLNEILSAHGDLQVEVQARFMTGDIANSAEAMANDVQVSHEEGEFKKCLITSDDGNGPA